MFFVVVVCFSSSNTVKEEGNCGLVFKFFVLVGNIEHIIKQKQSLMDFIKSYKQRYTITIITTITISFAWL